MPKKKRSASAIARQNQKKGKTYAKHIARTLAAHLKVPAEELYTSVAGLAGDDLAYSRAVRKMFPFSVECKCCNTLKLPEWIRQAETQAAAHSERTDTYLPFLVIFKKPGAQKDMVCLELEEFLRWVI